jgi:DNA repair exonuclease SbcCD ATPase subunit
MHDAQQAATFAPVARPELVEPLEVLGRAADRAARTVLAKVGDDDAAAFECVVALDESLPHVAELLDLVPDLLRIASPGDVVSNRLAAAKAEFSRQQSALAAELGRLKAARDLETRATEVEAERDRLHEHIERLQRSRLVEKELPALRARRAELETTMSQVSAQEGDDVVRGLSAAARFLLELTEEQRSLLDAGNGRLVLDVAAAAETAARELARRDELTAELAARTKEADQLLAEQQRMLPGLQAMQRADRDLLAGFDAGGLVARESALGRVRTELAEIERRLTDVEELMRPLLRQHAQAYEEARQIRGWTG